MVLSSSFIFRLLEHLWFRKQGYPILIPSIQDSSLAAQLRNLRFLVLDEADRMVEAGHFQELEGILRMTARSPLDMDKFVFNFIISSTYLPMPSVRM